MKPARALLVGLSLAVTAMRGEEGIPFPLAGPLQPRHAREIAASNWSVGAETMDRDYTVYANWQADPGSLGVKKARIQGGWAKTEKQPDVYDFAWLDEGISDMAKQGVEPWLSLSYGDPIYEGGGGPQIKGRVPTSELGLGASARWVKPSVDRVCSGASFTEPLDVNLRTGRVHAIPREQWAPAAGGAVRFKQVPSYDSPVLLADRAALPLKP